MKQNTEIISKLFQRLSNILEIFISCN